MRLPQVRNIVHVGCCRAEEAPLYGTKRVIWFEANPLLMPQIELALRQFPSQQCFNIMLGNKDNENVPFHISSNGGASSSTLPMGTHRALHPDVYYVKTITVPEYSFDRMYAIHTIFDKSFNMLVLDCQGYELNVLQGFGEFLDQFDFIHTECNTAQVYIGCAELTEMTAWLHKRGFVLVRVDMSTRDWGDCVFVRESQVKHLPEAWRSSKAAIQASEVDQPNCVEPLAS